MISAGLHESQAPLPVGSVGPPCGGLGVEFGTSMVFKTYMVYYVYYVYYYIIVIYSI